VIVRAATREDIGGYLELAREVETWFGPMLTNNGFSASLYRHIQRGCALVAVGSDTAELLGGILFGARPPTYEVHWLVVSERVRRQGVGRALLDEALRRVASCSGVVEVATFGADHPAAIVDGSRSFYARLGFTPGEVAPPGPEGSGRQVCRKEVHAH
jgi:GNAT superfamily N-acetyltransferase